MQHSTALAKSETKRISVPKHLIISLLTILAIGPQYFLNLSYTVNQMIIQHGLNLSTNQMAIPSILSNLAFALGVPVGRVLSLKYSVRKIYLLFIFIFLAGSMTDIFSAGLDMLTVGRTVQGLSAGILFLTILPVKLRSFPNHVRHWFLFFVISGLFGSSAVGALFGALSLDADAWRWLFVINIFSSIVCLIVGALNLPKPEKKQEDDYHIDKTGIFILTLLMADLAVPLIHLQEEGFSSCLVWPFLLAAFVLLILFITTDWQAENPLVPFRALWNAKPISGTLMAVSAHISLIVALAGINGFLRNNIDLPFSYLSLFYGWFFLGIMATALFSTFFYDKWGAGVLGIIGSLLVIYVGMEWRSLDPAVSIDTLYFQVACLGSGVSMVLVSGALGTALAGDLHQASMRSVSLHFIRNFSGALTAPFLGWYAYMKNAVHYEAIREQVDGLNPEVNSELAGMVRTFIHQGLSAADAKNMAAYSLIANAKRSAILGAYHDLFTIFVGLGVIMLIASVGKTVTGKGRSLVKKEKRLLLPSPRENRQSRDAS
ncbi:Major Facilitator Superfamily protein [Fictibacillus solisalsi]|uniref:Major Facilitator Superfamily protein n=1 Tax=Fictibacillus solisalsi TaxID=459525 RepID=A0A1H0B1Z4_9BACL|nr:MFS transporter [Fictibacillus solisalsi]SDN39658.1 Major Facilitator Superfamily protein [Fictibacillus solisalsi]